MVGSSAPRQAGVGGRGAARGNSVNPLREQAIMILPCTYRSRLGGAWRELSLPRSTTAVHSGPDHDPHPPDAGRRKGEYTLVRDTMIGGAPRWCAAQHPLHLRVGWPRSSGEQSVSGPRSPRLTGFVQYQRNRPCLSSPPPTSASPSASLRCRETQLCPSPPSNDVDMISHAHRNRASQLASVQTNAWKRQGLILGHALHGLPPVPGGLRASAVRQDRYGENAQPPPD